MANCDVPGANKEMFIKQDISMFNKGGLIKDDFSSDENGYFEVEYTPEHSGDLKLGVYGSSTVLEFIPAKENLDLGNVYYGSIPTNFIIRLEINISSTESDTLAFRDFYSENMNDNIKIPGPFNSGVLDTIYNESFSKYPIYYKEAPQLAFPYYWVSSGSSKQTWLYFDVNLCDSTQFGDAVIVIE